MLYDQRCSNFKRATSSTISLSSEDIELQVRNFAKVNQCKKTILNFKRCVGDKCKALKKENQQEEEFLMKRSCL